MWDSRLVGRRLASAFRWSGLHLVATVVLYFWTIGVALGLGFKDREKWTFLDRFSSAVIPDLCLIFAWPGRLVWETASDAYVAFTAFILNSVLWGTVLSFLVQIFSRRKGESA